MKGESDSEITAAQDQALPTTHHATEILQREAANAVYVNSITRL